MKRYFSSLSKDFARNKMVYFMAIPMLVYYLLFHYAPMYGASIAFKDFVPRLGIVNSPWIGFNHFVDFFNGPFFFRLLRNTLMLNFYQLLFCFPAPIILALLLNEVMSRKFRRTVQTITYMPHFISLVVVCGLIVDFTSRNGIVNDIAVLFGFQRSSMLQQPDLFRPIFIVSQICQEVGWSSIIYMAALTSVSQELYEAARIDGAGRWKQTWHITLPGISTTVIILLILKIGNIMNVGFEKIILLQNPSIFETADVISSYVYRKGLLEFNYSFSAAVGLFNSVINFIFLIVANQLSKKYNDASLW